MIVGYFHMFVHICYYKNAYKYFKYCFISQEAQNLRTIRGNCNDIGIIYFNLFTYFYL